MADATITIDLPIILKGELHVLRITIHYKDGQEPKITQTTT